MRTLSANLTTAQQSASAAPYVHIQLATTEYISHRAYESSVSYSAAGITWQAVIFPVQSGRTLTTLKYIKLYIKRVGTTPGTLTVSIKATDVNGKPTGADLASGTYNANSLALAYAWIKVTMSAVTLSPTALYAIVIRAPTGDVDNYVVWGTSAQPVSANFYLSTSADSGSTWTNNLTYVPAFAVFGTGPVNRDKIILVDHVEEPFAEEARIVLDDSFTDFIPSEMDLRGTNVIIGYGFEITTGVFEYSATATLQVQEQSSGSKEGKLTLELKCFGIWAKIAMMKVAAGGERVNGTITNNAWVFGETVTQAATGATGKYLSSSGIGGAATDSILVIPVSGTFSGVGAIAGAAGSITPSSYVASGGVGAQLSWSGADTVKTIITGLLASVTALTEDSDDTFINSVYPRMTVDLGTNVRDIIRRILTRTKSGLRMRADNMHILWLNPAAAEDYQYGTGYSHIFFSGIVKQSLVVPNQVIFVDKLPPGGAYTWAGVAEDTESKDAYGAVPVIYAAEDPAEIASQAIATARAGTLLFQIQQAAPLGEFVAFMNCGQELWDLVRFVDPRSGDTTIGRVGLIQRVYQQGMYRIRISLGNTSPLYTAPSDVFTPKTYKPEPRDIPRFIEDIETGQNIPAPITVPDYGQHLPPGYDPDSPAGYYTAPKQGGSTSWDEYYENYMKGYIPGEERL